MKIVPAILTDKKDELVRMLTIADTFSQHSQIDIMDGKFVPSCSVSVQDLVNVSYRFKGFLEAHLMVEEPLEWLEVFKHMGAQRIIFHFEIKKDKENVISKIKERDLSCGLAVSPSTKISDFSYLVDKIDMVLFLSVIPGFYGSEFIPDVLDKISQFKTLYPHKTVGIDGGIKLSNLHKTASLGIDFICVGSAIFQSENPSQSYNIFSQALKS